MNEKDCSDILLMGRRGEMCYEMTCSEWIISRAASEGGDGGGKVWGRQKSVVVRRRRKKEKEASPCKDVYLTVVAVHCFCSLCCVSSPACSSVLVWHFVLCFLGFHLVCHTIFLPFSLMQLLCAPHLGQKAFKNPAAFFLSHTGVEEFVIQAKKNCTRLK